MRLDCQLCNSLHLFARCVHHDVKTSPSSNEEAQSDRSDKSAEEPEDLGSWWRGWWWWSTSLKGQITLHNSVILYSVEKNPENKTQL